MEHEDLNKQIEDLKQDNYLLRQEIRGLKKRIREAMPLFKMERDDDIHNITIYFLGEQNEYQPFIIFNLNMKGIDNYDVEVFAKQICENLMENEYD